MTFQIPPLVKKYRHPNYLIHPFNSQGASYDSHR